MKGKTYCKEENPLNTGYYAQPNNNFLHESLKGSKFFDRTNPIQLYPPQTMNLVGSIAFRERRGKFKWKEIMKLDLDQLVRNNDLTPLNDYLQDLIYASIDENDMQVIPEATFVKLVKMYQYILEYLMQTQQMFENENSSLQNSYNQLINDAMLKEKALKENKNMIRSLKKDKKEKEMILMTYKCILEEQKKSPNLNETDRDTSNIRYYCRICSGKKFSTEENLEAHMAKRHMHEFKNTPMRESTTTFDKKLEEMRTYFESYLKTYQGESFIKLYENQKNLESKLQEIKYEKTQELNDLEKNFRSTLMEMKEFYLKNSIMASTTTTTPITATTIGGTYAPPKNDQAEFISVFKEQVQVMNNALVDINNKNNEKISKILEQMSTFESTVAEEIKEIKDKKDKKKKEKKSEKEKEKEKLEDEELEKERKEKEKLKLEKEKLEKEKEKLEKEKLEREKQEIELRTSRRSKHIEEPKSKFIPSMTHVNSIEFTNEKKPVYIRDTTLNTSITNTKVHFNAGPLESDNDMEQVEENLKNKKSIHVSMRNINESIIRNESLAVEQQKFSFAPDASVKASMELSPFERPNEKEVSTTPLAPENQANLTVTPVESKPDIITHEIEEKPLSGIKSKQRGEFREENKEDKEKVKKQAREQLENFYYRFEDRDNETYESKKVNDYFKDTL